MSSKLVACIEQYNKDWWTYVRKFVRAADELLSSVRERSLPIDSVAQPIAFLYRHALELAIKGLIVSGNRFVAGLSRPPLGHNLAKLLRTAEPFLARFAQDYNPNEHAVLMCRLEAVRQLVAEIHEHDPASFAFRYPTTTTGQQTLTGLPYLDFDAFATEINDAIAMLGFVADHFEQAIECRG